MAQKTEVIIHCADTAPNWMAGRPTSEKVAEIRRWHVEERGWSDIGYAEIIDRDGTRYPGRDSDGDGDTWEEIGAHTKGRNAKSIGLCLIGGRGSRANDKFSDHFTREQEVALIQALSEISDRFGYVKVSGHNEYAQKACPGFSVPDWLADRESEPRTSLAQSKTIQASQIAKVAATASPVVALFSDMPWQNILVIAGLALVVLVATGIIDIERFKKWKRGDR